MKKAYWRLFSVVALTIGSIICFYHHHYIVAVPLLFWGIVRFVGYAESLFRDEVHNFSTVVVEDIYSSVSLNVWIDVSKVLQHPDTLKVVEKLKGQKIFLSNIDQEMWTKEILHSYQTTTKNEGSREEVSFRIQNGVLWKNEKLSDRKVVHHIIEIQCPDALIEPEYKKKNSWNFLSGSNYIFNNFSIRLLLINGILKLQIGMLDQVTSFDVIRGGSAGEYEQWHTITSFPLIYSYHHGIPLKHLFLNCRAIPECVKRNEEWVNVWTRLNEEAASYRFLCQNCDNRGDCDLKKWNRIEEDFKRKLEVWTQKEGFKDTNADWLEDRVGAKYARMWTSYHNEYLKFQACNLNAYHEENQKDILTDYCQERF